jgi:flagellum-specific peptidoglycan hydrolase FlgJ
MAPEQTFIRSIKDATIAACKGQNIVVSIAIAQACLESNFGLSGLSLNCNNFFGIKAGSSLDR